MLPKFAFGFPFCIAMLFLLLPFPSAAAETTNSMASMQREIDELKSALAKLERKMEKMEDGNLNFADQADAETEAQTVRLQLEAVNVLGSAMKFEVDGHRLRIRNEDEGLDIEHNGAREEVMTVRANLPISFNGNAKQQFIAFYFEVEILKAPSNMAGLSIGFCHASFPTNAVIGQNFFPLQGKVHYSIGLQGKRQLCFIIGGHSCEEFPFASPFGQTNVGDVLGIGLLLSPGNNLTIFAAANSIYLGSLTIPASIFIHGDLFPAITLTQQSERVLINFGKQVWKFDPLRLLSNQ